MELGGTTKAPGAYASPGGTFGITGTLTLDAQGDPNAVFIFTAASILRGNVLALASITRPHGGDRGRQDPGPHRRGHPGH